MGPIEREKEATRMIILERLSGTYKPESPIYKITEKGLRKLSVSEITALDIMLMTSMSLSRSKSNGLLPE